MTTTIFLVAVLALSAVALGCLLFMLRPCQGRLIYFSQDDSPDNSRWAITCPKADCKNCPRLTALKLESAANVGQATPIPEKKGLALPFAIYREYRLRRELVKNSSIVAMLMRDGYRLEPCSTHKRIVFVNVARMDTITLE